MTHNPIQYLVFCLMTASLAITYRRYLIDDGGLFAWVPWIVNRIMPINHENWNWFHKAFEKLTVVCATCQAGQLAFWVAFCNGSSVIDSLLCAGLSSVVAHILDEKYFAR